MPAPKEPAPRERRGSEVALPSGYAEMLGGLKAQVRQAQFRAHRVVNEQLIQLYWNIGREILTQQDKQGWGSGVIARLAEDLRAEFPQMKGFSPSNLQYMRGFAAAWNADASISQQAAGKLAWGHIMVILDKLSDQTIRTWYAAAAVQYGWSRNMLLNQIMNRTHEGHPEPGLQREPRAFHQTTPTTPDPHRGLDQRTREGDPNEHHRHRRNSLETKCLT